MLISLVRVNPDYLLLLLRTRETFVGHYVGDSEETITWSSTCTQQSLTGKIEQFVCDTPGTITVTLSVGAVDTDYE